ncbi:MAG: GYD domain-containing protein [Dehalococcoidia bacterium]|nr:GYD domain-containing protein [Dehalococcoidia bacterium]
MPKFLIQASYTNEGIKGLLREGGKGRQGAVEHVVKSLGGKVEAYYFAFGEWDVYNIVELPDHTSAVALSVAVNSTGAVRLNIVPLISAAEMDAATKKAVDYRPPEGRLPYP